MSLKDLLVYIEKSSTSLNRFRLSIDLAGRHGSRLTALYVREWNEAQLHDRRTAEMGRVSRAELELMDQRVAARLDEEAREQKSIVEAMGRERGVRTEWCMVEGPASVAVAQNARYFDLCVLGHQRSMAEDPNGYTFSERILFSSGRPSLFIPPASAGDTLGRHIVVAWNSSRAAARSLNDALPLIERAERVSVLTVNAEDYIARNGGLPAQRLLDHLIQHGASAELIQIDGARPGSIGDALQARAHELGGDLLVAGAFGQPRLLERMLGGATRDLLDRMSLPILMSN